MQSKFMAAINQLASEKNLPLEKVLEIVSHALRAAYRKDYGTREQNIEVEIDEETSVTTVYKLMEVMQKEQDIEEPDRQFLLDEAKKYKKSPKVGDFIKIDVTPPDYGRIAAQSAKQVIIQQIQEAEKGIITDMYLEREHEILNGYVNRVEGQNVYIDLDRTQSILRSQDQIPREHYQSGQRIKVYLDKVITTPKGPRLLISRTHPKLVNCLLELEIPEVREGIVKIESVAREPGVRTKVAVSSSDSNIDPIGACVGQRGVRIQNVMEEFNSERIDIIQYQEDKKKYLTASLAPAKISHIDLNEASNTASVYVEVDQRALAIGKSGQNVRLASMLTGWEIDIIDLDKLDPTMLEEAEKKEVQATLKKGKKEEKTTINLPEDIKDLPGITVEIAEKLEKTGFVKSIQLMGLNAEVLSSIEGISTKEAGIVEDALKGGKEGKKNEEAASEEKTEKKKKEENPKADKEEDVSAEEVTAEEEKPKKKKPATKKKVSQKKDEEVKEETKTKEESQSKGEAATEDTSGDEEVIAEETAEEEAVTEEKPAAEEEGNKKKEE